MTETRETYLTITPPTSLAALGDIESALQRGDATPGTELAAQLVHAARWALENAQTLEAVKDVKDHLRAAQVYFKQKHATMIATNLLSAELIRCQWRLGNELLRMPRGGGKGVSHDGKQSEGFVRFLEESKTPKSTAYRLQTLAQVNAQDLEQYLSEVMEREEITTVGVLNYFTSHTTVEPRDDQAEYDDGDNGEPPDTSDELPQPHVVTIVCRHCGAVGEYEV